MSELRILVTGVNGQIGGALRSALPALGDVIPADRANMDLSKLDLIPRALDIIRPDLIINPAAYTAVDQAEDEPDTAYRINAEAPRVLAEWAVLHRTPLVHFSTDYVFDGTGDRPWREDDATVPLSVYGASKLAGEVAIKETGGDYLIVRTAWIFAAQGRNFLTKIARLAREHDELRVVADQIGAPTSAEIVVRGVKAILSSQNSREGLSRQFRSVDGLIHLCASGSASWHDFACAIVDGLRGSGKTLTVNRITAIESKDYPTRAKRPRNSRLDMSRLQTSFGLAMPDWREGVDREIRKFCLSARLN